MNLLQEKKDKLRYRYPRGESYMDVIARLEPVIFELERVRGPVLVVGHRAVLRCLFAYFLDEPYEKIPYLNVPLHTVIRAITLPFGTKFSYYPLGEPIAESEDGPKKTKTTEKTSTPDTLSPSPESSPTSTQSSTPVQLPALTISTTSVSPSSSVSFSSPSPSSSESSPSPPSAPPTLSLSLSAPSHTVLPMKTSISPSSLTPIQAVPSSIEQTA